MQDNIPEHVDIRTTPLATELRAKFESLMPGLIDDGVLDVSRLGEILGVRTAGTPQEKEGFGLTWAGRKEAVAALRSSSLAALTPDFENSINFDTGQNVFIEGDNFEVLQLLLKAYNDAVDLIYIDPPYNTGNDFVYKDNFADPVQRYLEVSGQVDAEGNRLVANTDVSGRKHSNWISMIYPRLMLGRDLLSQEGAIIVSIDDNEVANLRLVMDEIFGSENFLGQFVWAAGRKNDSKFISESHEYMVVYCRNSDALKNNVGEWKARKEGLDDVYQALKAFLRENSDFEEVQRKMKAWYASLADKDPAKRHNLYSRVDERGLFRADNIAWPGATGPERAHYDIPHPVTGKNVSKPAKGWRFTKDRMAELIAEGRILFGRDESTVPQVKGYLEEREFEAPYSVIYRDGSGATRRLRALVGSDLFDNPKDELVLAWLVEFATRKDSIVLDFFAGSGTTGHSVMLQNARDGGNRRYVLVNAPEPTTEKSVARTAGFETIPEITRLRLKKVTEMVPTAASQGLRCFRIGPSAFVEAKGLDEGGLPLLIENTLRPDASDDDIAAEAFLKHGVRLDQEWIRSNYGPADVIKSGGVAVVLARQASTAVTDAALADSSVQTVIFLEDSFAGNDDVKANAYFGFRHANKTMKTM